MRSREPCWSTSAPFRCEWRPSRWQAGALLLLGLLAAAALLNCELETRLALPAALLAACWGIAAAWRELRRPPRQLLIPPAPAATTVDGIAVDALELLERGPLLVLRWRTGRRRAQLLFWPDTLPRARRRELRLAARAGAVSR
jgi:toxin CptA